MGNHPTPATTTLTRITHPSTPHHQTGLDSPDDPFLGWLTYPNMTLVRACK